MNWKLGRRRWWVILGVFGAAAMGVPTPARAADLPMLHADGTHLVDPADHEVVLRGCNLGNYLMLESWMFGGTLLSDGSPFRDGYSVYHTLEQRFGKAGADRLMALYRDNWIEPRDFELIKSFHFNVVRLPFDYRLVQEDQPPFAIRPDAFRWLDHAVAMAESAGVYVILDLHGTPGGQSMEDHTGRSGQDHLWNSPEDQQRTVMLWKAVAEHFKDRSSVAAYDLINEPYGNHHEDCRPVLARLLPEIAKAIRATGDQHVVFFPGALNGGIAFYGNPHEQGLTNVAFTEHYYPGLFGSTPALETQARTLNQELPAKEAYLQRIDCPYYVGEFNVVLAQEDPARLMRAYYDRFAQYGWAGTMWSYKLISTAGGVHPSAWYLVTNADPLPSVDLAHSSANELENFFKSLGTVPLAVDEAMRQGLTTADPGPLHLSTYPQLSSRIPDAPPSEPSGYTSVDIGGATAGYTSAGSDGTVTVMGGGGDIYGAADSCRFVSTLAHGGAADERATITSFLNTNEYAKAGVMARWGDGQAGSADSPDAPGAAMAMVNLFPDGTVALITRSRPGSGAVEQKVAAGVLLPVELRLKIAGGQATGMYRDNSGDWKTIGTGEVPSSGAFRIGLAVCSHVDAVLTSVTARLGPAADSALPAPGSEGASAAAGAPTSLLTNGSFEQAGDQPDLAAGWNRWGDWMNREAGWKPTHSGTAEIGYHHWQITSASTSGLWQDASVEPGKRYTFSIYAQHDRVEANQHDASTVELRLESTTPGGQVTVNSRNFDVSKLASGSDWTRLSISGTAASDNLRVLVVITPAEEGPRGGSIKLDDATLTPAGG